MAYGSFNISITENSEGAVLNFWVHFIGVTTAFSIMRRALSKYSTMGMGTGLLEAP